jgi:hypothetical protein
VILCMLRGPIIDCKPFLSAWLRMPRATVHIVMSLASNDASGVVMTPMQHPAEIVVTGTGSCALADGDHAYRKMTHATDIMPYQGSIHRDLCRPHPGFSTHISGEPSTRA